MANEQLELTLRTSWCQRCKILFTFN